MKKTTTETITIPKDEFYEALQKRNSVSKKINDPLVVWGLVITMFLFTANMVWNNVSGGMEESKLQIQANSNNITAVSKSIDHHQSAQNVMIGSLEKLVSNVEEISNELFTIKTSRFTPSDADSIKQMLSQEDTQLRRDLDLLRIDVRSNKDTIADLKIFGQIARENAAEIKEQSTYGQDTKARLRVIEQQLEKLGDK